ncbi:uncharacterized protein EDB91DRAFT_1247741 [Suillus paluster]|uniref:uncharacterized protein n=1 Tax=Suillus paluster TaxID=48578 RepID=UPI001B883E5C|nr:uncharacterized protein EDB91DRAFT_1247741 [Suillus paluster]KAG1742355.1 hypothetical protein EDB91DRAFT_1247741 [Suillus paluster]
MHITNWFINMIIDVLFLNGLYQYMNEENLDSVFGLARAASHNALSGFRNGTYSNIDASAEHFCEPYGRVMALIKLIQHDNAKRERRNLGREGFPDVWAVTDPDPDDPLLSAESGTSVTFEPVSVGVARKYLSAVRAWHIAQGWPPPLSDSHHDRINWSLPGLENLHGGRRKPLRPPISVAMLLPLKATLILSDPFDPCVWAMASCVFFGMMRFGEVSVTSRSAFNPVKHLTRTHAFFGYDLWNNPYARLDLPSAKTARAGESQSVFLNEQGDLCPLKGDVRPMAKIPALERINSILMAWGWGTTFGHSFRIGGASFYLAKKVDPEIVRIAGRWRSLAYETYIRAFEQICSQHLANAASF